ncbi:unnamed protein product [Paramecium sonneborni]|uniref:J domain-containing protein n=1 Tax=Paramecium sonneborni TaxID=65129 RepID=A0A8S1NK58_9CILI|nr:unnamed protein product [Paramecium sonneborni]
MLRLFCKFRQFKFSTTQFDPYVELGLNSSATMQEIKDAYIKLSKQYHPDINKQHDSHEKFKRIAEAYNILKKTKFEEQMKEEFKQYYYSAQSEEQLFKEIFGFYFHENPQEYYKPENADKRHQYQEMLKKFKQSRNTAYDSQADSSYRKQDFSDIKINRKFEGQQGTKTNPQNIYTLIAFCSITMGGIAFYITMLRKAPELQKEVINNKQINVLRQQTQLRHQQDIDNIKYMYSNINHTMLRFDSKCNSLDMLLNYTIFPDLEFYFVSPELFYEDEKYFLKSDQFTKNIMRKCKLNYRITHAIEAERCLQNIFVPVEEVLNQIEKNGEYTPPGIFMQFYGYIYFKIRHKPVIIENLIKSKQYISLFDLYFHYQTPIPYYYDTLNEFQIFNDAGNTLSHWEGNVYFSTKSLDRFYLKGNVKNIFMQRPQQYSDAEQMYLLAWGNHFEHFQT